MNKEKILIVCLLLISLSGCQKTNSPETNNDSVKSAESSKPKVNTNKVSERGNNEILSKGSEDFAIMNKPSGHNTGLKAAKIQEVKDLIGKKPIAVMFSSKNCLACQQIEKVMLETLPLLPDGILLLKIDMQEDLEWVKSYNIVENGMWIIFNEKGEVAARNLGQDYNSLLKDLRRGV